MTLNKLLLLFFYSILEPDYFSNNQALIVLYQFLLKIIMTYYLDVLLPIALNRLYTYSISPEQANQLTEGMRVVVTFGKRKLYTAITIKIHQNTPTIYEAKPIEQILDQQRILHTNQIKLWNWLSEYYMCSIGEVLRAALPRTLLLQGESYVKLNTEVYPKINTSSLTDKELLIIEALEFKSTLKISEICMILDQKSIMQHLNKLIQEKIILLEEKITKDFTYKKTKWIALAESFSNQEWQNILEQLQRAPKQKEALLKLFGEKADQQAIEELSFRKKHIITPSIIKALVQKGLVTIEEKNTSRITNSNNTSTTHFELSTAQEKAYLEILDAHQKKKVALLHGVTSSGKTQIYIKHIQKVLKENKQVLFLVPEIVLTTQLISRLHKVFGNQLISYHSRMNSNQRTEVWYKILQSKNEPLVIIGVRSAVFLPFQQLGLVIVDESHERTYKQFDPAPRYHGRDTAIVLSKFYGANVILGSATPSIESFYNAQNEKYALITLNKRYQDILMPDISLIDLKKAYRKKQMKGHFSHEMIVAIEEVLKANKQVILFQNRRGYAHTQNCEKCGYVPQCEHCDVSLTYHKYHKQLRCHYCSYTIPVQTHCRVCESTDLTTKGLGTEQIEYELKELFPEVAIGRMDQDTTKGKYGYEKIINALEAKEISILVGTQMISKGLDFKNVQLVGVLNADQLLYFPDYRADEHTYQLLTQVAGRAGRFEKRGKVLIQSFNPLHQILQQVSTNNYKEMYQEQYFSRKQYGYPPFCRLIELKVKCRDFNKTNEAAHWLSETLRITFKNQVLGPESPAVSRIKNQYLKTILIKIPNNQSISKSKKHLKSVLKSFESIPIFKSVRVIINVDHI